jgi:hypothetical protein
LSSSSARPADHCGWPLPRGAHNWSLLEASCVDVLRARPLRQGRRRAAGRAGHGLQRLDDIRGRRTRGVFGARRSGCRRDARLKESRARVEGRADHVPTVSGGDVHRRDSRHSWPGRVLGSWWDLARSGGLAASGGADSSAGGADSASPAPVDDSAALGACAALFTLCIDDSRAWWCERAVSRWDVLIFAESARDLLSPWWRRRVDVGRHRAHLCMTGAVLALRALR